MPLTTTPNQLGLGAPLVGPWFSVAMNLNAPQPDLTIPIANAAGWDWLPPSIGTLSLHVATPTRPHPLQKFLLPDGTPAVADTSIVALFTLLAEVEDRFYALSTNIAPADGTAPANRPTRARVRYLAMQLPETASTFATLRARFQNPTLPQNMSNQELAEYLGLGLQNAVLINGTHPMADLRRPGTSPISNATELLLRFQANENVVLSAFDHRGRALDPGAVAAWWTAIAVAFPEVWTGPGNPPAAAVAAARTVHCANAHEGTLTAPLLNRLTINSQPATAIVTNPQGPLAMAFGAAPSPDDAPVPRVAMLPSGTYAPNLTLWPAGKNVGPARDFVRVTVVDVEQHLVGQSRIAGANDPAPKQQRANSQNAATTRVDVARSAGPALLTTIDAAATATLATMRLANATEASVVVGSIDRDWGPVVGVGPAPPPPGPAFPAQLPQPTEVAALTGGDSSATNGDRKSTRLNS